MDIVRRYDISYHALNHYTAFGLLSVSYKQGNVRFYDASHVRQRLQIIAKLAGEGYSLLLIRKKLIGV